MIEGPAGILAVTPPSDRPSYEPSKRRLTWKNGAIANVFSGEQPDSLRGPQQQLTWTDELCAYQYPQETWDNISFSTRLAWNDGGRARTLVTTTPRPMKVLREIMSLDGCAVTRGTTYENASNLDDAFLGAIRRRYEGTRLGRQELRGEIIDDVAGALWTGAILEATRRKLWAIPDMQRVVVGVDPAANVTGGETGIVVAGVGVDGHLYVLQDASCRLRPRGWATRALEVFSKHDADRIIAESNNGGLMVEETIRTVDDLAPVKLISASRGKIRRAEPVAALFEQGRAHLVGAFPELEDQMTSYTGAAGDVSPDRMDAMVWAAHDLMLGDDVDFV
jgi:phage terminase large subunit-like protein